MTFSFASPCSSLYCHVVYLRRRLHMSFLPLALTLYTPTKLRQSLPSLPLLLLCPILSQNLFYFLERKGNEFKFCPFEIQSRHDTIDLSMIPPTPSLNIPPQVIRSRSLVYILQFIKRRITTLISSPRHSVVSFKMKPYLNPRSFARCCSPVCIE